MKSECQYASVDYKRKSSRHGPNGLSHLLLADSNVDDHYLGSHFFVVGSYSQQDKYGTGAEPVFKPVSPSIWMTRGDLQSALDLMQDEEEALSPQLYPTPHTED